MTHRRCYTLITLAAIVVSLTAAGAWNWEAIAYVEHDGRKHWVHTTPGAASVLFQPSVTRSAMVWRHPKHHRAQEAMTPVPRDGMSHEVVALELRWGWLPGRPHTCRITRSLTREEFEQEFGVTVE